MTKLQITKEKAIELYPRASKEMQILFEETFGKEVFEDKNAFKKEINCEPESLVRFNLEAFNRPYLLQILAGETPADRPELHGRALYLQSNYELRTSTSYSGGTIIEILKK